jgi:hypothetical protein
VTSTWRLDHYWLFASFRRQRVWQYPLWAASQACLVIVYTWGRSEPTVQADLCFAIACVWAIAHVVQPPFRLAVSNWLASVTTLLGGVNTWFCVMRAHAPMAAIVVDTNYTAAMLFFNCLAGAAVLVLAALLFKLHPERPAALACDELSRRQVRQLLVSPAVKNLLAYPFEPFAV